MYDRTFNLEGIFILTSFRNRFQWASYQIEGEGAKSLTTVGSEGSLDTAGEGGKLDPR